MNTRIRRWSRRTAVAASVLVAVGLTTPAESVTPGAFGSAVALSGSGIPYWFPTAATLVDGSTAVAWSDAGLAAVNVRLRKSGSSTFGSTLTHFLSGPGTLLTTSPGDAPPITVVADGPANFLLGWTTCEGTCHVVVATIGSNAASLPLQYPVSGSDVAISPARFATSPDGSAAAVWYISGSSGIKIRMSHRVGVAGAWSAPVTVGSSSVPLLAQVAMDSSNSITVAWVSTTGSEFETLVRSLVGSTWSYTIIAGTWPSSAYDGLTSPTSLASGGASTILATVDSTGGSSLYSGVAEATAIRILQRAASSAPWTTVSTTFAGPGRYAAVPQLAMNSAGGAVLRYEDYSDGLFGPGQPTLVTTRVTQRTSTAGAWSSPITIDAVAVDSIGYFEYPQLTPALAADGQYLTAHVVPVSNGASGTMAGIGLQLRSTWSAGYVVGPIVSTLSGPHHAVSLIDPAGRAAVAYLDSTAKVSVQSSALPKPFVRSAAKVAAAPHKGVNVTCSSAWTDAASVAYRWLRNGGLIAGPVAATYKPVAADVGKKLSCRVTGKNLTGSTVSTSAGRTVT
ncbi:MAG: hypothetical protein WCJ42_07105 [Actinomycetes bacterium]